MGGISPPTHLKMLSSGVGVNMPKEKLRMDSIVKIYPNGFVANKGVTFSVNEGEIHALLGENGAGKTTLMNILFGLESHEGGTIYLDGEPTEIANPLDAINHGIGMVHQHFKLVPSLTIAENIMLGIEPKGKAGTFDFKRAVEITKEIGEKYNISVDPYARIRNVSVGMMQQVELMKILVRGADIIVLDEPTAVLTPQETEGLFRELKTLKEHGHTIIFISHKLNEVMELCDRFTVLRHGELIGVKNVSESSTKEITRMMIGKDVEGRVDKTPHALGDVQLSVENLGYTTLGGKKKVDDVSFKVRGGEILGIAAIEGNGQNEVAQMITGIMPVQSGNVSICGDFVNEATIRQRREKGLALISDDRYKYGCSRVSSILENLLADRYYKKPYSHNGVLNNKVWRASVDQMIADFDVRCNSPLEPAASLSGGNCQKMISARELTSNPKVIVANQPTRGIDVGSAELVRGELSKLSVGGGAAVLLISADLEELLEVSDKIIVMHGGKLVAYFDDASKVDSFELGEYMLGAREMPLEEIRRVAQ